MALTPKLLTDHPPLAAAAMIGLLALTIVGIAEYAPRTKLVVPADLKVDAPVVRESTAPRAHLDVAFPPNNLPRDATECSAVADEIFAKFAPITAGLHVEANSARIAHLVNTYIESNCPNAIHQGNWDATAEILGVGVIFDVLHEQAAIYGTHVWHEKAGDLIPVATSTFDVLAPESMCDRALRQDALEGDETNEFTVLTERCLEAFGK